MASSPVEVAVKEEEEEDAADPLGVVVVLKPKQTTGGGRGWAAVAMTKAEVKRPAGGAPPSRAKGRVTVALDNSALWKKFCGCRTEMLLTRPGRLMFPYCSYRLEGLDPDRMYLLAIDFRPADNHRYRWTKGGWQVSGKGDPHMFGRAVVHPESPATGGHWMGGPVTFSKLKLTNNLQDREGHVVLRSMHCYLPHLYVVPVVGEDAIRLDGPGVDVFTFPQTEFFAVTSYQNHKITMLKLCNNPNAKCFRENGHLAKPNPKRPPAAADRENGHSVTAESNGHLRGGKRRHPEALERAGGGRDGPPEDEKAITAERGQAPRTSDQRSTPGQDGGEKVLHKQPAQAASAGQEEETDGLLHVDDSVSGSSNEGRGAAVSAARQKTPLQKSKQAKHQKKAAAVAMPKISVVPKVLASSHKKFTPKGSRRGKKPKQKCWSHWRSTKGPATPNDMSARPLDVEMQPALDDVEGLLFVSFTSKEAHDAHVPQDPEAPPSPLQMLEHAVKDEENPETIREKVLYMESILLSELSHLKYRQVVHPALQDVGLKLHLLDPAMGIDLQYLGVTLPFPVIKSKVTAVTRCTSSYGTIPFVSRTGKTNDLTKIKGWREKFNSLSETPHHVAEDGAAKIHSAFSSDMLDEYLENEAKQISDRAAAFSHSAVSPIAYRTPPMGSSYIRTLHSVLKPGPSPTAPTSILTLSHKPAARPKSTSKHKMTSIKLQPPPPAAATAKSTSVTTLPGATACPRSSPESQRPSSQKRRDSGQKYSPCAGSQHIPALNKPQRRLLEKEVEAFWQGHDRTYVTTERATMALHMLLTAQGFSKTGQDSKLFTHKKPTCSEDFCRLGCVCSSLHRDRRGPTHCQRPQCMFGCSCFKQKVRLIRSKSEEALDYKEDCASNLKKKPKLMAFALTDPNQEVHPKLVPRISRLWNRKAEDPDPEPLVIPNMPLLPTPLSEPRRCDTGTKTMTREKEKDPVYLYFESKMTCARVREFNSEPPPQIHIFPNNPTVKKQTKTLKRHDPSSNLAKLLLKPIGPDEGRNTPTKNTEPSATKLLEIVSECNWEPHRSLVLSALCRRVSLNLLTPEFKLGFYCIRLISTKQVKDGRSSTITYKVSIARQKDVNKRADLKTMAFKSEVVPLSSRHPLTGYLKATTKPPGSRPQRLIQVNGKYYTQAKLLLGQIGALHPASRLAAFVTGRLTPLSQKQSSSKPSSIITTKEPSLQNRPSGASIAPGTSTKKPPSPVCAEKAAASKVIEPEEQPLHTTRPANPSDQVGSHLLLIPVTPTDMLPPDIPHPATTSVPAGHKVMLQPVSRASGETLYRQSNGQLVKLVSVKKLRPIKPGPVVHSQGMPVVPPTPESSSSPPACQDAANRPVSLSGKNSICISKGTPAMKMLPQGFMGKGGTYSFRICPPTGEGKAVVLEPGQHLISQVAKKSPTLALPGGFTLIKLPKSPGGLKSPSAAVKVAAASAVPAHILKVDAPAEESQTSKKSFPGSVQKSPPEDLAEAGSPSFSPIATVDWPRKSPGHGGISEAPPQQNRDPSAPADNVEEWSDMDSSESSEDMLCEEVDVEDSEDHKEPPAASRMRAKVLKKTCTTVKKRAIRKSFKAMATRDQRSKLQDSFVRLKDTLQEMGRSVSKLRILSQAQHQIADLLNECATLEARKAVLSHTQSVYIKKVSQISGKSEEMIRKKLCDISERQRRLERHRKMMTDLKPQRLNMTVRGWFSQRFGVWRPNVLLRRMPDTSPSSEAATPNPSTSDENMTSTIPPQKTPEASTSAVEPEKNVPEEAAFDTGVKRKLKSRRQDSQENISTSDQPEKLPATDIQQPAMKNGKRLEHNGSVLKKIGKKAQGSELLKPSDVPLASDPPEDSKSIAALHQSPTTDSEVQPERQRRSTKRLKKDEPLGGNGQDLKVELSNADTESTAGSQDSCKENSGGASSPATTKISDPMDVPLKSRKAKASEQPERQLRKRPRARMGARTRRKK